MHFKQDPPLMAIKECLYSFRHSLPRKRIKEKIFVFDREIKIYCGQFIQRRSEDFFIAVNIEVELKDAQLKIHKISIMLGYEIHEILLIFGKIASNLLYWHLIREIALVAGASKIGPLLARTFR